MGREFNQQLEGIVKIVIRMSSVLGMSIVICLILMNNPGLFTDPSKKETYAAVEEIDEDRIENGIHIRTGFVDDEGLMTVVNNCTNCHSAKLVTQNRMSKERWAATIKWMQKTQNLWDLGANEAIIVNYLAKNYAPNEKGRRENLSQVEWYELDD